MTIYGYSGENNHFPNLTLTDNTFISGTTFVAGNVSGQRTSMAGPETTIDVNLLWRKNLRRVANGNTRRDIGSATWACRAGSCLRSTDCGRTDA